MPQIVLNLVLEEIYSVTFHLLFTQICVCCVLSLLETLYSVLILIAVCYSDSVVSEAAVRGEAEELEMTTERYIQDLQQALTETETSITYSFSLTPSPPDRSSTVTLAYEKVQKDISVSETALVSLHSISV